MEYWGGKSAGLFTVQHSITPSLQHPIAPLLRFSFSAFTIPLAPAVW
jgi:hypothetical protein